MPLRRFAPDLALIFVLLLAPLLMFHQQTLGGYTLLPTENLYQDSPYSAYRETTGAPPPHNALLSDMVLQNYQWKAFLRQQIAQGEIPLWNPHLFAGIPFFAAGQHSALYPLSIVYYLLPLPAAYGWFILLNLWLAGLFMAAYLRALGIKRAGAALAGVVYQLSGFLIANAVFPMIVAAAVWLPLLLWMIENILRGRDLWIFRNTALLWVVIGALAIGCNILAGHIELTLYTLLIAGYYAAFRLLWQGGQQWRASGQLPLRWLATKALWLLAMVFLGLGLAALQLLPLYEFAQSNWRAERSSLETVRGYGHPPRDILLFLLPNFYGNPTHHGYFDIFSRQWVSDLSNAGGGPIFWGMKNYLEAAVYVGILPLCLALYALLAGWRQRLAQYLWPFAGLGLLSLSFMFGLPTYALIFALPGMNQLNTPFRWVYALTLALAALAGIGLHLLAAPRPRLAKRLGWLLLLLGAGLALASAVAYLGFEGFAPLFDSLVNRLAKAAAVFADGRMFFSYQLPQVLLLAALLLLSGLVFLWAARSRARHWQMLALALVVLDLLLASFAFNPASKPELLDFTPPSIEFLQAQPGNFRVSSLLRPNEGQILNSNVGLRYGLDDIRGYDSIIPASYVKVMRALQPQYNLKYNRIASQRTDPDWNHIPYEQVLTSDLLNLLNLRYILTAPDFQLNVPGWQQVYAAEVAIWQNDAALPRAFVVDKADWKPRWLAEMGADFDLAGASLHVPRYQAATISHDSGREKFIDISVDSPSWLVISENYSPGWRAFIRPFGAGEDKEFGAALRPALANLQAVELPPGNWTARLVYSPASVQLGLFTSCISVALIIFLLGAWFWRAYIGLNNAESSGLARVARNSIAPIMLNLFNRAIDMAFAIVMYRLLSQTDVGIYNYAIVLFVAFDIFTNFGLDLFLIREAAQKPQRAGHYFYNTSLFRLVLSVTGLPLLAGVLLLRQVLEQTEPLPSEGLLVIGLLYIGLFPASLSKGMTSLFYAKEQAEKPAAIATITTINKAVLGVIALLLGYGIVGLAAISIFNNLLTLLVLLWAGRKFIGRSRRRLPDLPLIRSMTRESLPLMLNHFLATIFFQVDILILEAIKGFETVAQYSTAYKWLLAINIVPAFFHAGSFPRHVAASPRRPRRAQPHLPLRHQAAIRPGFAPSAGFHRASRAIDANFGRRALSAAGRHRFAVDDLEHPHRLAEQLDAIHAHQLGFAAHDYAGICRRCAF